jgi:hypothetical protein
MKNRLPALTLTIAFLAAVAGSGLPAGAALVGTAAADPGRCTTDQLAFEVQQKGVGLGTSYYTLRFTNTGTETCTLLGRPGVFTLDAAGDEVGSPAGHHCCGPAVVLLAPGGKAHAPFTHSDWPREGQPGCERLVPVSTLRLVTGDGAVDVRGAFDEPRCADEINGEGLSVGAIRSGGEWTYEEESGVHAG